MGLDRILHGGLPLRTEYEALLDRYIRQRAERLARHAACGNCSMFEPPTFRNGRVGNPFGFCSARQETREAADPPCLYHERIAVPADEEHGDVGASR